MHATDTDEGVSRGNRLQRITHAHGNTSRCTIWSHAYCRAFMVPTPERRIRQAGRREKKQRQVPATPHQSIYAAGPHLPFSPAGMEDTKEQGGMTQAPPGQNRPLGTERTHIEQHPVGATIVRRRRHASQVSADPDQRVFHTLLPPEHRARDEFSKVQAMVFSTCAGSPACLYSR